MRRFHLFTIITSLAMVAFALGDTKPPEKSVDWELQYQHDETSSDLTLTAIRFASVTRGVAAGFLVRRISVPLFGAAEKTVPTMLVTADGGGHWTPVEGIKDLANDLFFIDDSIGWMAGEHGIWKTEESGRSWRRISSVKGIAQIHFLSPTHGFAVGDHGRALESQDGGASWKPIAIQDGAVEKSGSKRGVKTSGVVFNVLEFGDANTGMIAGNDSPEYFQSRARSWADPEAFDTDTPVGSIFLVTHDGGKTWTRSQTITSQPLTRASLSANRGGLALFEHRDLVPWPSQVFRLIIGSPDNHRLFRERNRAITDVLAAPHGEAWLAGFQPVGRVRSPIPGKVKILRTEDLEHWKETTVDYRAVAHSVMLASPGGDDIWAATDTGMILHYRKP